MLSHTEYQIIIIIGLIISILVVGAIVALVILLVRKFKSNTMQEGYEEEEHQVPVPGYDDDN